MKPITNCVDEALDAPSISNAAQVTAEDVSVGLKSIAAVPALLRSWISIVGGEDDAESITLPWLDIAATLGGEGCEWTGTRRLPVDSEYAWIELLSGVLKKSMRESGEKRSSCGLCCTRVSFSRCFLPRGRAVSCRMTTWLSAIARRPLLSLAAQALTMPSALSQPKMIRSPLGVQR